MRNLILAALLLALPTLADVTIINVTNSVTDYNEASGVFSATAGNTIRLNVQSTDGVTNQNFAAGGGHTFAVYLYSLDDSPKWLVYSNANTTAAVADPASGQVRFEIIPPGAGYYEIYAEAIPNNAPETRYPIAWHYLAVSNAASSFISLSFVPLIPSNGTLGTLFAPWRELYAVDGYFAGSLTVGGDVNVEGGFEALDSTKVAKVGETNSVILTNAIVSVSDPTNELQVANKQYVDALAVTNLNDLADVDAAPSSGDVLTYDGSAWTNAAGGGSSGPATDSTALWTNATVWHKYESYAEVASITNANIGTWVLTNSAEGSLLIYPPLESVNQPRIVDRIPISNTNAPWSAAFTLSKYPRGMSSSGQNFVVGLGSLSSETQGVRTICFYRQAATPGLRGFFYANLSSAIAAIAGGGTTQFPADPNTTMPLEMYEFPQIFAMDFDGTNTYRGFVGFDDGYYQRQVIKVTTWTNVPSSFVSLVLSSVSAGHITNMVVEADNFQLREGERVEP